ncbi:WG repeat-containing protein [Myroides odoratimimus]|uniref:WG repeat-containing protein n=1 Tax=Myroides odoratimimus TaxID=76832 RepID=UPI002575840B|nr:WG repeat-containing protein [Myroides odoratimimus]MDM1397939.1 WG repeat-containing protein [Myroides odoratimimus]
MKTYLNICILFLITQVTTAQVDIKKYNATTTNQEYIDLLKSDLEDLNRFVRLFSKSNDKPSKPTVVAPLKLAFNQQEYDANIDLLIQANIRFIDFIAEDAVTIQLIKDPAIYRSLDDIKAPIYVEKVYYHDGTTQNMEVKKDVNTHFTTELGLTKAVDKIDIRIPFSTMQKLDSIVLPAAVSQKAKYNGVDIEVVEVSDKSVLLRTSSDQLELDDIQAILRDKRRVKSYMSQRSGMHPDQFDLFLQLCIKKIREILALSEENINMEHSQFKKDIGAKMDALEKQLSTDYKKSQQVTYLYYEFGEPIDKIVLYKGSETYQRDVTMTLSNSMPSTHFIDYKDDKTLIYNKDLKLVKEFSGTYTFINDCYFRTNRQYFYLNDKLEMQPLSYYKLENLVNNFIVIKEDDESPWELVDPTNKKIMKVDNYEMNNKYNFTLIESNASYYLLNKNTLAPQKITNVDKVSTADKGYFIVEKNNKFGFMNTEGKIVVPIQYDDAHAFDDMTDLLPSDLLFAVKQNEKWGFVDIHNKTVIPFMYDDVKGPFSYGIAPVYLNDTLGLINLKNEKVSKFMDRNYFGSSNFGKRTMGLSDGTYNHKGEKEKK